MSGKWSTEPVEVTWAQIETAIAFRLAIRLGKNKVTSQEIADLAGISYNRIGALWYFLHTRDIAHYQPGRSRGCLGREKGTLTQGATNRVWLKKPKATMHETWDQGVKILPRIFGGRRFAMDQEYDLNILVEEALSILQVEDAPGE